MRYATRFLLRDKQHQYNIDLPSYSRQCLMDPKKSDQN